MASLPRPTDRPRNPCFSSGPCAKRPGWDPSVLAGALVGRSHRSKAGRARIQEVLDRSRALLGVPDASWIPDDREGLAICDATSAVFAMDVPIAKLDVVTYSWQKVLGGEAQHGMLILSPRAIERLQTYKPTWPLPKIFRMTKAGEFQEAIFKGDTINTSSMLRVEDALDGVKWAESVGGLPGLIRRSEENLAAVGEWVARTDWVGFLAEDPRTRSCTSICLKIVDPWFTCLEAEARAKAAKGVSGRLEVEEVAYDIAPYREAPPGLRLWGGATVERGDLEALFPWLDWTWAEVKSGA